MVDVDLMRQHSRPLETRTRLTPINRSLTTWNLQGFQTYCHPTVGKPNPEVTDGKMTWKMRWFTLATVLATFAAFALAAGLDSWD